jgi:hypothetical protein
MIGTGASALIWFDRDRKLQKATPQGVKRQWPALARSSRIRIRPMIVVKP